MVSPFRNWWASFWRRPRVSLTHCLCFAESSVSRVWWALNLRVIISSADTIWLWWNTSIRNKEPDTVRNLRPLTDQKLKESIAEKMLKWGRRIVDTNEFLQNIYNHIKEPFWAFASATHPLKLKMVYNDYCYRYFAKMLITKIAFLALFFTSKNWLAHVFLFWKYS